MCEAEIERKVNKKAVLCQKRLCYDSRAFSIRGGEALDHRRGLLPSDRRHGSTSLATLGIARTQAAARVGSGSVVERRVLRLSAFRFRGIVEGRTQRVELHQRTGRQRIRLSAARPSWGIAGFDAVGRRTFGRRRSPARAAAARGRTAARGPRNPPHAPGRRIRPHAGDLLRVLRGAQRQKPRHPGGVRARGQALSGVVRRQESGGSRVRDPHSHKQIRRHAEGDAGAVDHQGSHLRAPQVLRPPCL